MSELSLGSEDLAALAEHVLGSGNIFQFRASGSSMRPFIREGDTLEIEPFRIDQTNLADILVYKNPDGRLIVHRVVRLDRELASPEVTLQGDAFLTSEYPVSAMQILGRVISIHRGGRIIYPYRADQRLLFILWRVLKPFRQLLFHLRTAISSLYRGIKKH